MKDKRYKKGTPANYIAARKHIQKIKRENKFNSRFRQEDIDLSKFKLSYVARCELLNEGLHIIAYSPRQENSLEGILGSFPYAGAFLRDEIKDRK